MKRVEKETVMIMSLQDVQRSLLFLLIIGVGLYFFGEYELVQKGLVIATGFVIFFLIKELIYNFLAYRHSYYEISEDTVHIKGGGFSVWETTLPISRIQHLDVSQSFYARFFDLYSLNIYTAGDDHDIKYLKKDPIDSLHQELLAKMKMETEKE
ncbi:PH domain-containing protein [Bacillus sp. PS06]|uniref:PH domain-containing protein n=1 Tax=Bacillus sp. PS06 TaxID=2764176 RepID=UPI001785E52F|nr:PH domain-containing protein [Bacillus sp. PS06]MBD8070663.1 PH domain-containing protein [Bacillus sp. PS06]